MVAYAHSMVHHFKVSLGRLLRDGAECVLAFPNTTMPSWAETKLKLQGVIKILALSYDSKWARRQFKQKLQKEHFHM